MLHPPRRVVLQIEFREAVRSPGLEDTRRLDTGGDGLIAVPVEIEIEVVEADGHMQRIPVLYACFGFFRLHRFPAQSDVDGYNRRPGAFPRMKLDFIDMGADYGDGSCGFSLFQPQVRVLSRAAKNDGSVAAISEPVGLLRSSV